jgi:DNA-binding MarR family transcriptional regulator
MENESLLQAAIELMPLLDRTLLRLRYRQDLPGITPLEYRILDYTCYHAPVRIGAIGAMAGLSWPNASRYVKDLVGKGLLQTERDPQDGRAQMVSPSPAGSRLLAGIEDEIGSQAARILSRASPAERDRLERACRELSACLTALAPLMEAPGGLPAD